MPPRSDEVDIHLWSWPLSDQTKITKSAYFPFWSFINHPTWPSAGTISWADVLNRANLGMEVMHERNAHNFPLDLAAAESTPVALQAPAIG